MADPIQSFVGLVREYTALISGADGTRAYELLSSCSRLLPRIYAAGMDLPDVQSDDDVDEGLSLHSPMSKLQNLFGRFDTYYEVFDPVFDQEAIPSSLADDLADVYLDLARPLATYDAGHRDAAVWQWRFNVRGHCGDHLVDALRTIHRLVNDHMVPDYQAGDATPANKPLQPTSGAEAAGDSKMS